MKLYLTTFSIAMALFALGCGEDVSTSDLSKLKDISSQPKKEEAAPTGNPFGSPNTSPAPTGGGPQTQPDNKFGQPAPIVMYSEIRDQETVDAQGGVGKRGQGYGGGIYTEPIRVYFRTYDQITFIQMHNNIKTYRALHNDKNPPTREEFVQECLVASNISLPELPPNHYYAYDPDAKDIEKVMRVVQPAK